MKYKNQKSKWLYKNVYLNFLCGFSMPHAAEKTLENSEEVMEIAVCIRKQRETER
jgi:hypothetical protein